MLESGIFMKHKTYLINLDGSEGRLHSAKNQLSKSKITFDRISAINGHRLNLAELLDYDSQKTEAYMGRPITGGEIGCFYSHISALKTFIESGERYCVVFEDDFLLAEDFTQSVDRLIEWLEKQVEPWDLVNISAPKCKYFRSLTTIGERELRQSYYFPMLATAILWTRDGAIAFLDYHKVISAPYDNALREWQSFRCRGLTLFPPIVSTTGSPSDIDGNNKPRNHFRKSAILYGYRKRRRTIRLQWRAIRNMFSDNARATPNSEI